MTGSRAIGGWNLFWLAAGPISIAMIIAMTGTDLSSAEGVSSMIQLSVRCAVPWLFLTFAVSALQKNFPGRFSRWLLRNRKYFGLVFAATMAWQGFFILWLVLVHTDYYVNEVYVMRDAIEGVIGYLFLAAMTVTSFPFARKRMRTSHWRTLHLSGIYFLWAYAFTVYWWALFYYGNPVLLDYVYYVMGLSAWVLRAVAWGRMKRRQIAAGEPEARNVALGFVGIAVIGLGLIASIFGSAWSSTAARVLYGYPATRIPELYLPYWPFEPFLSLAIMGFGLFLISRTHGRRLAIAQ